VVLHDLDQAAAIADRLLLLEEGRVTAEGSPEEVLTTTNLTRAYGIRVDVVRDPVDGRIHTRAVGRFNEAGLRAASA
jgi:iron complex transport system ATP-binding protein